MIFAHGVGSFQNLPVPTWLFFYGAAVVLVVSFVALAALWRQPVLEGSGVGHPLREGLQRVLLAPVLRVFVGALSFAVFCILTAAALFGVRSTALNLAPTFVYVLFWVGLVPVTVLFGYVWSVLNPWKAAADAAVRLAGGGEPVREYPARLGRWPAVVLLFSFAALELAYARPGDPRALGVAILVYTAVTWTGAALFGRDAWFRYGDGFSVYFGLLSRMAPFGPRERDGRKEIVVRPPLVGLAEPDTAPGTLAFVSVMLGGVAFDGFSQTSAWQDRIAELAESSAPSLFQTLLNLAGLTAAVCLVALAYLAATALAGRLSGQRGLAGAFVLSLVPVAFAYVIAHYFTLLIYQSQFAFVLASDPFGRGWDLFGTADYQPNVTLLSPNAVWYIQVGALVIGHAAGLALAHDRALAVTSDTRTALRTQYALLALMVLYTVGGLWLLSRG